MHDPVNRPLRVLMVSWEYPPAPGGGLGRHVQGLSTALAAAGHDVTVLTQDLPGTPRDQRVGGVRVLRVAPGPLRPRTSAGTLPAWGSAVDHVLTGRALVAVAGNRYDIVHSHDWLVAHTAAMLATGLGAALVATVHTTGTGPHERPLPPSLEAAARAARQVITCSRYMRRQVVDVLGVPAGRVRVVAEGVDPTAWMAPAREVAAARLRFIGAGPLIGYAGRLAPGKGVPDLLSALPLLRQRFPGLRAVVAGDGPSRPQLRRQARLLGLSRAVSFTGFLGRPDLAAILGAVDALVVPGRQPSGLVALEGAVAGSPLAVANAGGVAELVESGLGAVTFPAGDPAALAEAVSQVLDEPAATRQRALRAREKASSEYTWAVAAAQSAAAYAAAIESPARAPGELHPLGA